MLLQTKIKKIETGDFGKPLATSYLKRALNTIITREIFIRLIEFLYLLSIYRKLDFVHPPTLASSKIFKKKN